MSYLLMLGGFLATTNAGRFAAAVERRRPAPRDVATAMAIGATLVIAAVLLADDLLDALSISPESFRIAAGMVLAAAGLRVLIWPLAEDTPFAAVLVTPELVMLALSLGADEPAGKVLAAAAPAFAALVAARRVQAATTVARFLAALAIVVAVALAVSGIADV